MKKITKWVLPLFMVLVVSAVARTWTSADGQTVEADLIRVKDGKAYLQMIPNRKIVPVEISKLSEADQVFLAEYQAEQGSASVEESKSPARTNRKAKWHKKIDAAQKESKALKLPIFVLFTAPDWCEPCTIYDGKILQSSAFKDFANSNLVLFELDCSLEGILQTWQKKNPDLAKKCAVGGYPTAFLIGVNGEVLGQFGSQNIPPEKYVETIKARIK